jgi:hypothetical protein
MINLLGGFAMITDRELFAKSIYFRIGYTKRIGRMEGSVFYYKMRKNTLTVRMIKGRNINFIDIIRLIMKDRDFINYYLSDRYDIQKYKDCDARILPIKPSPKEAPISSFIVDMGDSSPLRIEYEFEELYRLNNKEMKFHIPLLISYLKVHFPGYVDIVVSNKIATTTVSVNDIFDNTVSMGHYRKHLSLMGKLDSSKCDTSAFLERFLMSCRSEDTTYTGKLPNTLPLFPYRKLRDLSQLKADGAFDKVYGLYKKFINEYHVVYIKNRMEDFDISKEECMTILTECGGYQPYDKNNTTEISTRPVKTEFSNIFDYSKYISSN